MSYISLKNIFILSLLLSSSFYLFANENHEKKESDSHHHEEKVSLTIDEVKNHNLPVATAKGGSIYKGISLFGKIELHPEKSMHVHPKNSGVVKEVFKSLGDRVTTGTILARIESNVGIEAYNLVSVIEGVILEKNITAGQSVSEETEAFTVADTKSLIASFVAYPRDFIHLKMGQKIYLQHAHSKTMELTAIYYISPLLQDKTRTGQLLATIDNQDNRWISGQYVIGKVFNEKKEVSLKLSNSLLSDPVQEKLRIFVKNENSFSPRDISLGERDFESVEVLTDLKEGDEYIALSEQEVSALVPKKDDHNEH